MAWNAIGLGGLGSGVVGWLLAAVVLAAAPGRSANRRLALVLFLEGATGWTGGGLVFLADSAATAYAAQAVADVAFGAMVLAYLAFLGTLPSPLSRPLRPHLVGLALAAGALTFAVWFVLSPELFVADVAASPFGPFFPVNGPLAVPVLIVPSVVVFLYGLAAAIAMWRTAPLGTAARKQGATYAVAFAVRDVAWIAFLLDAFVLHVGLLGPHVFNALLLVFQLVLAYGILKHQLLDIDLRVKWTIRRGALVGAFVAAFFVVAAIAEQYLQRYGVLVGGIAVGLLLFALRPLERAADRLADRAMPRVHDSQEYRLIRKRQVYTAAVESAMQDGTVTDKERDVLATLADQLGLTAGEARAIERDALAKPEGFTS